MVVGAREIERRKIGLRQEADEIDAAEVGPLRPPARVPEARHLHRAFGAARLRGDGRLGARDTGQGAAAAKHARASRQIKKNTKRRAAISPSLYPPQMERAVASGAGNRVGKS